MKPYPPSNPVINLRIFVDSFILTFWINQSINITIHNTKHHCQFIKLKQNRIYATIEDMQTPVHLAHTGN